MYFSASSAIPVPTFLHGLRMETFALGQTQAILRSMQRLVCYRDRGLWVVNASGLHKLDFLGKSDPYAKVGVWFVEGAP